MTGASMLAMDLSAPVGSLALLGASGEILAHRCWIEPPRGCAEFWRVLTDLVQRVERGVSVLSMVAVGRGPGRYTGLRTSMICARALALANAEMHVHAVDSGAALALGIIRHAPQTPRVVVVGDARRGQCWIRAFRNDRGRPEAEGAWRLCDPREVRLPPGSIGVSPEWSRLEAQLVDRAAPGWIREDRAPDAVEVGLLARHAVETAQPPEPLQPLYVHPAVAG